MTTQQKIEAIRQKCIEANPEIVELKFGCRISGFGHHMSEVVNVRDKYTSFLHAPGLVTQDRTKNVRENYEIIGRPIRLADVLLVLGEKYAFDGSGSLMEREFGTSSYDSAGCSGRWNLYKDDLTMQDEATIDFIHDLLK